MKYSLREVLSYLGPGFIISVAYMDPGNWATNISGGAKFGTALLWVIVLASFMAMGIQIIAAKLGIATGKGVAQLCRERFSRRIVIGALGRRGTRDDSDGHGGDHRCSHRVQPHLLAPALGGCDSRGS